jgi:hypothetical protein
MGKIKFELIKYLVSKKTIRHIEYIETLVKNYNNNPFCSAEADLYGGTCTALVGMGVLKIVGSETCTWEYINHRGKKVKEEYDRHRYDFNIPIEECKALTEQIKKLIENEN